MQTAQGQNLFSNPGFEAGNSGFQSDYGYAQTNCCEGQYTVSSTPGTFNGAFTQPPPSSPGSSQMMVINGSAVAGPRVWFQTVTVAAGTTYRISLSGCTAVGGGPASLQWSVGGQMTGTQFTLPQATQQWIVGTLDWVATTSGPVEFALFDVNVAVFPNDFYIDDMVCEACPSCATLGLAYCGPAVANSTGAAGAISASGSTVAAANDVTLDVRSLPNGSFGFFLTSLNQGIVMQPGGSLGVLCLGGSIGRYVGPDPFNPGQTQIQNSGSSGSFSLRIDLNSHPTPTGLVPVTAGETWYFQAWYRDSDPMTGNAVSNLTDGLAITFV